MAKLPGLVRRGAVYYYRRRVPLDVRNAFGRDEVVVSLQTTDRKAAESAWLEQRARWDDEFDGLRENRAGPRRSSDPAIPDALTDEEILKNLRVRTRVGRLRAVRHARGKHDGLRPLDKDEALRLARLWFSRESERLLAPLPDDVHDALMDCSLEVGLFTDHPSSPSALQIVQSTADVLLQERGLDGFPRERPYEVLCEYLSRAMLELARRNMDRLSRHFDKPGYDYLFSDATPLPVQHLSSALPAEKRITVKEAKEQFQAARVDGRRDLRDRTKGKARTGLELVMEFFGPDTPLASIDSDQCEAFQKFLQALPPNFTKLRNSRSLRDVADIAARQGMRGLMRATRESYFAPLRQMLAWAKKRKLIEENPALDVTEGRMAPADERKRHSFTPEQLRQMFLAPLYQGCVDDQRGFNTPGPNHPRNGRFWLPLLGLFTGARLGELCQLRVSDIMSTEKGTPFIRIHAEGEGMSVKNENSWRSIPIHPELERIGFSRFVEERRTAGVQNLFPELLVHGRMAGYRASKLFTTFRKAVGVDTPGVCFHSFRHTFRDALRLSSTDIEIVEALGGWSNSLRTSSRYGEGHSVDRLKTEISKVRYEGLDLSFLYPAK